MQKSLYQKSRPDNTKFASKLLEFLYIFKLVQQGQKKTIVLDSERA